MSALGNIFGGKAVQYSGAVRWSPDFARIDALPRFTPPAQERLDWLAREWTARLKTPTGTMTLRPLQALALEEMLAGVNCVTDRGGVLLPLGVGTGKTLVGFLAPRIYNATRPVLFTYASLRGKTLRDAESLALDWDINPVEVFTWEDLSSIQGAEALNDYKPDLIIADEVHAIKGLTSSRTIRFLRYFESYPTTILVAMSGTITSSSLRDFAHIAKLCLGQSAPVPFDPHELYDWCLALDATLPKGARRKHPGILSQWGENAREAYHERLVNSPGVVASTDSALGTALNIATTHEFGCDSIMRVLRRFNTTGTWGDAVAESPLDFARVAKTLSCGYWLEWQWPNGEPDLDWLLTRNAWARECRRWLEDSPPVGLDSPALLESACQLETDAVYGTALMRAWLDWAPHREKAPPPVRAQFIDGAIQDFAAVVKGWTEKQTGRSITWVPSPHLGLQLTKLTGLPWYPAEVTPKSKAPHILVSEAHAVGHNLQEYSANLVLIPPASGQAWEQLLGRTHRPGQLADSVEVTVCTHHSALSRSLATAKLEAKYIEQTTGNRQKLCMATWL